MTSGVSTLAKDLLTKMMWLPCILIKEIQVEGNTFSFTLKVPTPMGKFELHYSGQIDADLMQGKIDTPRGAMPFTGKRTK